MLMMARASKRVLHMTHSYAAMLPPKYIYSANNLIWQKDPHCASATIHQFRRATTILCNSVMHLPWLPHLC